MSIHDLRRDYERGALNETDVDPDPIAQFKHWLNEALTVVGEDAIAMTLATVSADHRPFARTVLLRGADERGFTFFTNYESPKGRDLAANPHAALCFLWLPLSRQVRITGVVTKTSPAESDAYFGGRPPGSQLGAWASPQGEVIASREALERQHAEFQARYADQLIPRPPHWGGYRLRPEAVEFWQGRSNRLHDRLRYRREGDHKWVLERLAP